MDVFNAEQRSAVMRSVKSKDTTPEIKVRRLLHRAGYRYRIHRSDLPGKPDIVFAGRRAAIFIHGCFWHQHPGCPHAERPSSNNDYWTKKLNRNIERDKAHIIALQELGWKVLTIWECEISNSDTLLTVKQFLESRSINA
ncbi:MAG: very short patch repair endonuclease [Acidobacteria bacterium]|nr:MAG: very short patch repair endonuclease [Acidobacteriota bacterium]